MITAAAPDESAAIRASRAAQNQAIAVKRDGRWLIRSEVFVALTCRGNGCETVTVP